MSSSRLSPLSSRLKGPILSLDQFLTRQKVLTLYRSILRLSKHLPPSDAAFVREWARSDFDRYRNVDVGDVDRIRMLLSQGMVQLRTLETSVTLAKRGGGS
ncbi:LYR motif-containing protein 2 [Fimicolochytrium jonesii]|uniref:LYR motif-containing protein 2 n=1 Tax=Fimicolochytrium jonesii TaxID=1396493 RepID=UPI0022FE0CCC|nr:LYR motif-containing protein 2 [Fimicolochytrium jonesii]KAI8820847.1 LYR motif-containing protein 2 [Fimicolochytrium jonesii]